MRAEYVSHHYVPQWYQRRFIPPDQMHQELHYWTSPAFEDT